MAVNFNDDTWKWIERLLKEQIEYNTSVCTSKDKTYKEMLQAQGAIAALTTILKQPQLLTVAAKPRG